MNQDPLGIPGKLVYSSPGNMLQIWTRPLALADDLSYAFAAVLFNREEDSNEITLTWQMLNEV